MDLSNLLAPLDALLERIEYAIREFLKGGILNNFENMFTSVNEKVGDISINAGQTPQSWNYSVFNMIRNLSQTVIIPIAGMIIAFVLCYELITMITERNNMKDVDTFMFFKFVFKGGIAVYLLSHTFDITMAIFDVGQFVVNRASGVVNATAAIDISSSLAQLEMTLDDMSTSGLFGLLFESMILQLGMNIIGVLILVIVFYRMISIYLYVSVAPIPFSTMTNREWGSIGTNYVKGLIALAFQGFFMIVVVAIYAALVNAINLSGNLHVEMFTLAAYTVVLCMALFKTENLSKSIFHAH